MELRPASNRPGRAGRKIRNPSADILLKMSHLPGYSGRLMQIANKGGRFTLEIDFPKGTSRQKLLTAILKQIVDQSNGQGG